MRTMRCDGMACGLLDRGRVRDAKWWYAALGSLRGLHFFLRECEQCGDLHPNERQHQSNGALTIRGKWRHGQGIGTVIMNHVLTHVRACACIGSA